MSGRAGRKLNPIWDNYDHIATASAKGWKAKCKKCQMVIQGLVDHMMKHSSNVAKILSHLSWMMLSQSHLVVL